MIEFGYWCESVFHYGWDFVFCFALLLIFLLHRRMGAQQLKWLLPAIALNGLIYYYGFYIPAFAMTIVLYVTLFFATSWRFKSWGNIPLLLAHFAFSFFFLSAIVATAFGERFYVYSPVSQAVFVGYKPAKLIAAIGDGDTGTWYFYQIGMKGVRSVMECFTRSSERPFSDYIDLFKKEGANARCPDPPGG